MAIFLRRARITYRILVFVAFSVAIDEFLSIFSFQILFVSALTTTTSTKATTEESSTSRSSLWKILQDAQSKQEQEDLESPLPQQAAWKTIFGVHGERGEYMDGYSQKAMIERCVEDYKWEGTEENLKSDRANMMSYLYEDEKMWKYTCMVAFAEHYVLAMPTSSSLSTKATTTSAASSAVSKPYETFCQQKGLRPPEEPIFAGVLWDSWESGDESTADTLTAFRDRGIDYVRLHCNLGAFLHHDDVGARFESLATSAKECQSLGMVPLILLQVPWREASPQDDEDSNISVDCFERAMVRLAVAFRTNSVEPGKVLLETRPPIGVSTEDESGMSGDERIALGLRTGRRMFDILHKVFGTNSTNGINGNGPIAGFCVAGGSTKGSSPTAMRDDTQNAVRQGVRARGLATWGYEVCFWEMGAKRMLQPEVGRLWGGHEGRKDAARELFRSNARALAEEIVRPIGDTGRNK